jgi:hypothetical protein
MANLGYTVKGQPIQQLILDLKVKEEQFKLEVNALAPKLHEFVSKYINERKVRPSGDGDGNLERQLAPDYFDLGATFGWLMGNISKLEQTAPYWNALDSGSKVPPGNQNKPVPSGIFSPGQPNPNPESFRQGQWKAGQSSDGKKFSFIAKKPIIGINYIDEMYVELNRLVAEMQQRLSK